MAMNLPSLDLTKVRSSYRGQGVGHDELSGSRTRVAARQGKKSSPREKRLGFGEASRLYESGPRSVRGEAPSGAKGSYNYARAPLTSRNTVAKIRIESKVTGSGAEESSRAVAGQKARSVSYAEPERAPRQTRLSSAASVTEAICEFVLELKSIWQEK